MRMMITVLVGEAVNSVLGCFRDMDTSQPMDRRISSTQFVYSVDGQVHFHQVGNVDWAGMGVT